MSFIVVFHNGADYIRKCLDSIRTQTYEFRELIAVDNGSTDNSADIVRTEYPNAILVHSKRNIGCAGASNLGFAKVSGELVALVNSDVVLEPNWTEVMVEAAMAHPQAAIFAPKIYLAGTEGIINSAGTLIYPDLTCINRGMREADRHQYDSIEEVFGFHGTAAMLRRRLLDVAGWFDDSYFMHREEDDLAWRCHFLGWSCIYVPQAIAYHHWSRASGGGYSMFKLYYGERNRIWNIFKYLPVDMIVTSVLFSLRRYLVLSKLPSAKGAGALAKVSKTAVIATLVKAYFDALKALPAVWHKRKAIRMACPRRESVKFLLNRFKADISRIVTFYTG
ncbi:MAG: glycosyltransferase family 2 protein [candidate division WOR-3 bacterium]